MIVEVKCAVRVRIRRRALWMPIAAAPAVTLELVGLVLMAFRMATKQQLIVVERLVARDVMQLVPNAVAKKILIAPRTDAYRKCVFPFSTI